MIEAQAAQGDLPSSPGERMPVSYGRRDALVRARCALGIVHAHYWRAVSFAEAAGDASSRACSFAEARRLAGVAVALAARARAPQVAQLQNGVSPRSGPTGHRSRRRPGHGTLRAA